MIRLLTTTALGVVLASAAFAQSPNSTSRNSTADQPSQAQSGTTSPSNTATGATTQPQQSTPQAQSAGSTTSPQNTDRQAGSSAAGGTAAGTSSSAQQTGTSSSSQQSTNPPPANSNQAQDRTTSPAGNSNQAQHAPSGAGGTNQAQQAPASTDRNQAQQAPASTDRNQAQQSPNANGTDQAQQRDQRSNSSQTASRTDSVNISKQQETRIGQSISRMKVRPVTNVNFSLNVGTVVPRDLQLATLPPDVVDVVPQYRGYSFALVKDEIVVVDPSTYKIVDVLPYSGQATAATTTTRERVSSKFSDRDREVIRKHARSRVTRIEGRTTGSTARTDIRIGERVPDTVEIEEFPSDVYREAPDLREYRYINRDSHTYIVEPHERRVIEDIE